MSYSLRSIAGLMRQGSAGRGQCYGQMYHAKTGDVCALGAVYIGIFGKPPIRDKVYDLVYHLPPIEWLLMRAPILSAGPAPQCPVCGRYLNGMTIYSWIAHLNDAHHLSIRDIADIVEQEAIKVVSGALPTW